MSRILPTPQEMIRHLDIYVRGQDAAKRALSKAIYFHYLNLVLPKDSSIRSVPEHCLLIGPTGSGKTHLVKTISSFLGVPVMFCNAASLSAEGYVGESVGDMLARYARFCDGDKEKMQRGIIFLDEIDKLRRSANAFGPDVRGSMVQQELLAVLDGNLLVRSKESENTPAYAIDTSQVLIIASGAFHEIDKIVAARTRGLGFRTRTTDEIALGNGDSIESNDITEYGFLPELVARFSNLICLDALTQNDVLEILKTPEQSPIAAYRRIFHVHGIELDFTPSALAAIAERAQSSEQGARGLRQAIADCLKDVAWRIGDLSNERVTSIVVK